MKKGLLRYFFSFLFTLPVHLLMAQDHPYPGLQFIENKNQWDSSLHFSAKIPGGQMFVNGQSFFYYLKDEKALEERHEQTHHHDGVIQEVPQEDLINGHYVRMNWLESREATPQPFGKLKTYYNFFLGADESKWGSHASAYEGVFYSGMYEGIDLRVYSQGSHFKYDFILTPGAEVEQIRGLYDGADALSLDEQGNLFVVTTVGELIEKRPYAYQVIHGTRMPVACEFVLENSVLSFSFPEGYDPCEPLVIDPLLIFSTYSGSTADNWGSTATPGERGTLYSAGVTNESTVGGKFPASPGAFQQAYGGHYDVAILKYDSAGQQLLWASYLGGSASESPHSLVMNDKEELLVLGTTSSTNFPTTSGAFDRTYNGGVQTANVFLYENGSDIFVARISKEGSQLLGSTYLGGSGNDGLNPRPGLTKNYGDELRGDIIADSEGNIYISTVTSSPNFPVRNSFGLDYGGGAADALLLKLTPDLSDILWGAYLGGSGIDAAYTLKLDANNDIFTAGGTTSDNFPVTGDSFQPARAGDADGWIAHVAGDGSSIKEATFTGTSSFDQIYFLDLNAEEEVYVYGQTNAGTNFPVSPPGVYANPGSGQFVQKFNNDLSVRIFSTVFGSGRSQPDISPTAFLVNECNNIYMTGWGGVLNNPNAGNWSSSTVGMPFTDDAFQKTTQGSDFYFIVLTDDATEFLYGTYMGGSTSWTHVDGGTSRFDKGGIVYHAVCSGCRTSAIRPSTSDFPTTPNAWSRINRSQNCNNAAFKFDLSSLKARLQTNSVRFDMPGLKFVCQPDTIAFQNFSTGGETYFWDLGDGTKIVKTDTSSVFHQYNTTGRYLVSLKAVDPGTCIVSDSTAVYVDVFKKNGWVMDDAVICEGSGIALEAGGGFVQWTTEDGTVIDPAVSPVESSRYFVTVTETNGCVLKDTVDIAVVPKVTPEFEFEREGTCLERPVLHVRNQTEDGNGAQLLFDFGDGTVTDAEEVAHQYQTDDVYRVKLTGIREFCVYEKEVVMPIYSLFVPNIITPGLADNYNDRFIVRFGQQGSLTPGDFDMRVSLVVYNRWGKAVYESSDYQYDWSGEGLSEGVYYYDLSVEGQSTCKSWLHVVK